MLIDNVMLTERKRRNSEVRKCSARVIAVHTTKNMGCVVNVCTHKQLMGGTSFFHAERLKSSVETAVG